MHCKWAGRHVFTLLYCAVQSVAAASSSTFGNETGKPPQSMCKVHNMCHTNQTVYEPGKTRSGKRVTVSKQVKAVIWSTKACKRLTISKQHSDYNVFGVRINKLYSASCATLMFSRQTVALPAGQGLLNVGEWFARLSHQ